MEIFSWDNYRMEPPEPELGEMSFPIIHDALYSFVLEQIRLKEGANDSI